MKWLRKLHNSDTDDDADAVAADDDWSVVICIYLRDKDAGVVNTERMTGMTLTSNNAETKRSTGLENCQCLYT